MVTGFDRIVIAVPALAGAAGEYRQLLGMEPVPVSAAGESPRAWFCLPNTVIELVESPVDRAAIEGIVFTATGGGAADNPVANTRGLNLSLCNGEATATAREQHRETLTAQMRVDHLVLRTGDAADCIALFEQQLGIRLALDKTVPEWGGRMLFFRAGKLTLEVIEQDLSDSDAPHIRTLEYLREAGFRLCLDDFRVAAASLASLEKVPFDEIKIHASALRRAQKDPVSMTVLAAVTGLAHNLGMSVCAEGVEDQATFEFLKTIECDKMQGFLISEAVLPNIIRRVYSARAKEESAA